MKTAVDSYQNGIDHGKPLGTGGDSRERYLI